MKRYKTSIRPIPERDTLGTYREAERFIGQTRMRYAGSAVGAIVLILGISAATYLGHKTMQANKSLDIISKVTSVIGTEDGKMSEKGLQRFLNEIRIPYAVKKGDMLDLTPQYWSPIEIKIISEGKTQTIGSTDTLELDSYIKRNTERK